MARALFVLTEGFEEIEAVTPLDLLRRAGVECVVAGCEGEGLVRGRCALRVWAEVGLEACEGEVFDAVVLPGGPGVARLRADARVAALCSAQHARGGLVAAICAAPLVLKDAGLLPSRRHTAHKVAQGELPGLLEAEAVVLDDRVLTSRGAGTALQFGLALIEALLGEAAAQELARSIHVF
jgi:4-methyl-5(b-hydroxyethyl)-thiazole monophosphate biosynthesis